MSAIPFIEVSIGFSCRFFFFAMFVLIFVHFAVSTISASWLGRKLPLLLAISTVVGTTLAHPSPIDLSTHVTWTQRAACTPTSAGVASRDDVPAIEAAIQSCGNGGTIVIPAGKTYMIRSPLDFAGCTNCDFQIEGTLKVSDDYSYWNGKGQVITMSGIRGAKIHSVTGSGVLDGNGQTSYEAFASDSSIKRPKLHTISGSSSDIQIYDLQIKNAPNVFFSVKGDSTRVQYRSLDISATSNSSTSPKNTDGFDIGQSSYVTISAVTVSNQDDCVAFKPGANYVTVSGITCTGSHGLSVGSLGVKAGTTDTVQNIYVTDAVMKTSSKAIGIKLHPGGSSHGTAIVSNVTFDGVVVSSSDYAAQIQSCYNEDASYCASNPSTAQVKDIYFKNFSGTTSSSTRQCWPISTAPLQARVTCISLAGQSNQQAGRQSIFVPISITRIPG